MASILRVLGVAVVLASGAAQADGGGSSAPRVVREVSSYDQALAAIKAGQFQRASGLLDLHTRRNPRDAEGWNWLGFARRKSGATEAALVAYERALALDPGHRGAHEYIGEAYLARGEPERAEHHLHILEGLCRTPCEQLAELRAAIGEYRARAAGR